MMKKVRYQKLMGLEEKGKIRVRLERSLLSLLEGDLPHLIRREVVPALRDNFKKEADRQRLRRRVIEGLRPSAPTPEASEFLIFIFEREDWQDGGTQL